MKNGKKPTRTQRMFLQNRKLNAFNWLVVKDTSEVMDIIHRKSGKMRRLVKCKN